MASTEDSNSSSKSFGMYESARALAAQGKDLIHLEIDRPIFDTPLHIKEATKKALDEGKVHDSDFFGELKLRQALAKRTAEYNKLNVNPEVRNKEILTGCGEQLVCYGVVGEFRDVTKGLPILLK